LTHILSPIILFRHTSAVNAEHMKELTLSASAVGISNCMSFKTMTVEHGNSQGYYFRSCNGWITCILFGGLLIMGLLTHMSL